MQDFLRSLYRKETHGAFNLNIFYECGYELLSYFTLYN